MFRSRRWDFRALRMRVEAKNEISGLSGRALGPKMRFPGSPDARWGQK